MGNYVGSTERLVNGQPAEGAAVVTLLDYGAGNVCSVGEWTLYSPPSTGSFSPAPSSLCTVNAIQKCGRQVKFVKKPEVKIA